MVLDDQGDDVSSHADTIRNQSWPTDALAALDALLAENQQLQRELDATHDAALVGHYNDAQAAADKDENQRLREALERVKRNAESWHGADPDGIDNAHHGQQKALNVIAGWCSEALAGDGE